MQQKLVTKRKNFLLLRTFGTFVLTSNIVNSCSFIMVFLLGIYITSGINAYHDLFYIHHFILSSSHLLLLKNLSGSFCLTDFLHALCLCLLVFCSTMLLLSWMGLVFMTLYVLYTFSVVVQSLWLKMCYIVFGICGTLHLRSEVLL